MRYKTGEKAPQKGSYQFDGYTDGSTTPAPTAEERVINLDAGETFPPISSARKAAYWRLI